MTAMEGELREGKKDKTLDNQEAPPGVSQHRTGPNQQPDWSRNSPLQPPRQQQLLCDFSAEFQFGLTVVISVKRENFLVVDKDLIWSAV